MGRLLIHLSLRDRYGTFPEVSGMAGKKATEKSDLLTGNQARRTRAGPEDITAAPGPHIREDQSGVIYCRLFFLLSGPDTVSIDWQRDSLCLALRRSCR
jgi:hypothetical protein